jgi:hypothetical protein
MVMPDVRALVNNPPPAVNPGVGNTPLSVEELKKRIFANRAGSYGEGAIGEANKVFKELQSKLASGEITQQQYVDVAGQLAPDVKSYIAQIAGSGSRQANAAEAAGASTFNNEIGRDLDIYKTGRELLGRDLTQNELYSLRPKFAGPNGGDVGKAYLAELATQEAQSPEALGKKAPEYAGKVNDLFSQLLGREATGSESGYYGKLLASGEVDPYEIEQQIKAGQEFQGGADKKFRGELAGELGGYTQEAFGKAKEDILSRYSKAGLNNSSDLDFALANAMKDLESERGQFLTGVSASQYGGNKGAAREDYRTMLDRRFQGQDYGRGRSDSMLDYYTQRADQGVDYQREMNDYMAFLNGQPKKKKTGAGGLAGTLIGGGLGAYFGGPAGAKAGADMGNAGGGLWDWNQA